MKRPFFGHGIGYIREWGDNLPHNMYLTLMVEHGFMAAILLPLLVLLIAQNATGEAKNLGLFFGSLF